MVCNVSSMLLNASPLPQWPFWWFLHFYFQSWLMWLLFSLYWVSEHKRQPFVSHSTNHMHLELYFISVSHTSMISRVWIPRVYINARQAWTSACTPSMYEEKSEQPLNRLASQNSLTRKLLVQVKDPTSYIWWREIRVPWGLWWLGCV